MSLTPKKVESLRKPVRAALEEVEVRMGHWPMRFSMMGFLTADYKLGHGADKNQLAFWLDDDMPVTELAYAWLTRGLRLHRAGKDVTIKLKDLAEHGDLDAVTEQFLDLIRSLPLRYTMSFKLPFGLLNNTGLFGESKLGENARLIRATAATAETYPLSLGSIDEDVAWKGYSGLLDFTGENDWDGDFLIVCDEGYASHYSTTNPMRRAEDKLRAVVGFALAEGLLEPMRAYRGRTARSFFYVHEQDATQRWRPVSKADLSAPVAALMEDLKITADRTGQFDQRCEDWMFDLRGVFSDELANRRLITAAQWYFDAIAGERDNPLLAFVQMMVVLEIIYGDEAANEKIGLTELLRNRCAYAIGRTTKERDQIRRQFNDIYGVRSKIVHTGKNRLNAGERLLFDTLSQYCRRSIRNEIKMAERENTERREGLARALDPGPDEVT